MANSVRKMSCYNIKFGVSTPIPWFETSSGVSLLVISVAKQLLVLKEWHKPYTTILLICFLAICCDPHTHTHNFKWFLRALIIVNLIYNGRKSECCFLKVTNNDCYGYQ